MAEMAKGAVDSVLGTIGAAIGERAALMGSVRRDMRFIKGEMESMNGFLLDVDDPAEQSNQVQAWMRQVRDVAYDSQSCIDRYVQTVGAGRSSAGLLGSVGRAPQVLRTLPDRYRIAMQIKEIKSRAQEVGERRQRYGVQALATPARGGRVGAKEAEEDAAVAGRRRRALADAENLLGADAREVAAWVTRGGKDDEEDRRASPLSRSARKFIGVVTDSVAHSIRGKKVNLELELATAARELLGDRDPENIADAAAIMSKQEREISDKEVSALIAAIKQLLGFRRQTKLKGGDSREPSKQEDDGDFSIVDQKGKEKEIQLDPPAPAPAPAAPPPPPETTVDPIDRIKTAATPMDVAIAEKQYSNHLKEWLSRVFNTDIIEELVLGSDWMQAAVHDVLGNDWVQKGLEFIDDSLKKHEPSFFDPFSKPLDRFIDTIKKNAPGGLIDYIKKLNPDQFTDSLKRIKSEVEWLQEWSQEASGRSHGGRPRILAIVTPPVDAPNPEDDAPDPEDDESRAYCPATQLARRVYDISRKTRDYDCVAWINAGPGCYSKHTERLQCLLQQVLHPLSGDDQEAGADIPPLEEPMNAWSDDLLAQEIQKNLQGKKFLIVLADHEDEAPWLHIASALPHVQTSDDSSTIIITPVIQQPLHFHGWYLASWLFLLRPTHYRVHFYSHVEALSKKANELLVGGHNSEELQSIVKKILQKCRWDAFSTSLFLRALYVNPRRSENELVALLHQLQDFSTVSIAREIISFCYDDLPSQYQSCLHYMSMFPRSVPVKKGSVSIKKGSVPIKKGSLLRRWAAENLVTTTTRHALDDAERCFNALVDRGLVLLVDISSSGKAKTCNLPDQVLSFIITKIAREDTVESTNLPPKLVPHLSIRNKMQLQQLSNGQQATHFSLCRKFLKCTSPTDAKDYEESSPVDVVISFLNSLPASSHLGLIRVLDLEGCPGLNNQNLRNICNKKFQLKYLSLRKTEVDELPKEIVKLQDLETFDIRETKIKSFPMEADELQKLIHLLAGSVHHDVTGSNEPVCTVHMPHGIMSRTNIQVLSHVEISHPDDVKELKYVGQLQQLRKLGVVIPCNNTDAIASLLTEIGKLDECLTSLSVHIKPTEDPNVPEAPVDMKTTGISHPRSLQSLIINGKISELPPWIKKLHRLSKVTLRRTSLNNYNIHILGTLMSLRIVVLGHDSCEDNRLNFKTKEFKQLEVLVVVGSNISHIHFDLTAAPKLEKIIWTFTPNSSKAVNLADKARKADMSGIDKLPSLRQIELHCSSFDIDECNFHMDSIRREMFKNPNNPILAKKIIDA